MPVIDTHTHIIAPDRARYRLSPAGGEVADRVADMPVSAEALLGEMDKCGVDRAVFVQYYGVYGNDNDYVVDSVRTHSNRAAGVCIIDVLAPDATATLKDLVLKRGIRGLRLFQSAEEPHAPWLHDRRGEAIWELARELHLPVVMGRTPSIDDPDAARHLPRLRALLARFSDVPVALDHLGVIGVPAVAPELPSELLSLAEFPNVYGKLTTVSLYRAERVGVPFADFFGPLFERFGANRVMWGSNYPNTYDRPYPAMVEFARDALSFLDTTDREWVFGRTALELWPELG